METRGLSFFWFQAMRLAIPCALTALCAAPLFIQTPTQAAPVSKALKRAPKVAASKTKVPKTATRVRTAPRANEAPVPLDFDGQKAALRATRVDTLDELRDGGRDWIGKTVEVRGQVKGLFGGSGGLSVLLELPSGQTQIIGTPAGFSSSPCAHTGNWMRALCHVESVAGRNLVLTLVRATDQPERASLEGAGEDTSSAPVPGNVPGAPPPGDVLIAPEADLPAPPPSSGTASSGNLSSATPPKRNSSAPAPTPRANPFYGFDDLSRSAFRNLALRCNPRLSEDSADAIASFLLEAAQAQGLDPRFLAAVVQVESRFNPYAVSGAGAEGLGQLMPFNLRSLGVQDGFDARQNLQGTARLLRQNLNIYARDPNGTMLAVAAYHAGVGAVNRAGRAIPKTTTQRYVWKVYYAYRALAPELFR